MSSDDTILPLAAEFPPADQATWRRLVEAALKGADFDKKLVSATYDGLKVAPLYPRAQNAKPVAGRSATPWQVMARVDHPDPALANRQLLEDLENGATGFTMIMAGSVFANGYGLDGSAEAVKRALGGVYLEGVGIDFNVHGATREAIMHVAALIKSKKLDAGAIDFRASLNPLGGLAAAGGMPRTWPELAPYFAKQIVELSRQGFRGPFAVADGRLVHSAGGSEAQELSFALASAVLYMRALEAGGLPLDKARDAIYFRFAADDDQFLTIAKFRAARKLWVRVETACGLASKPVHVAAETAWRMMTKRDAPVNMLRTSIAIAAAGIGGADSILALPHTIALGLPDALARRIVRNAQLVLLEESNLYRVADPAAGSGAIESMTTEIAGTAWDQFQEIEKAGGLFEALKRGLVQAEVAKVRAEREKAIARRKDALTGTSEYPDLTEISQNVLDVTPSPAPQEAPFTVKIEPLPRIRLAEPFEALRDRSDTTLKKTGARPKIFLANLGRISDFTARAMFARNFYEAGGIEAVTNDGFKSRDDMIAAFKASGAKLAILCSSDKVYAAEAVDAAKALTSAGAVVHLAGRPGDLEGPLKDAGVKTFIFMGSDVLATLKTVHATLGLT
ncbi:MAG: methylmalonyl-CoA mutase small subunit [Pseudolabrys sp.]|nr:methylmalonyl-CoA mutase small subunit [Pseudolabrys sp.]